MRIAVQGCGRWGSNWVRVLADILGEENVVKVDPNVDGCVRPIPFDWTEAVDAVVIATPTENHFAATVDALDYGLHVMVEKPMTLRADYAEELVELANEKGRILMTNHIMLVHPGYQSIKEMVRATDVIGFTAQRFRTVSRRGGLLWNLAAHDLSMAIDLMGTPPVGAKAYRCGNEAALMLSWPQQDAVFEYSLGGEKTRKFVVTAFDQNRGGLIHHGIGDGVATPEPLKLMAEAFIRSCKAGKAEVASGESALPIIKLLEEVTS